MDEAGSATVKVPTGLARRSDGERVVGRTTYAIPVLAPVLEFPLAFPENARRDQKAPPFWGGALDQISMWIEL